MFNETPSSSDRFLSSALNSQLSEIQQRITIHLQGALLQCGPRSVQLGFLQDLDDVLAQPDTITERDCHKAAEIVSKASGWTVVFYAGTRTFYCFPTRWTFQTAHLKTP